MHVWYVSRLRPKFYWTDEEKSFWIESWKNTILEGQKRTLVMPSVVWEGTNLKF